MFPRFCGRPTRSASRAAPKAFSTSLLECAACAAVPIVTHVGGVDELIPDESYGRVIGGMDPALVAGAVRELAADRRGFAAWPRSCSAALTTSSRGKRRREGRARVRAGQRRRRRRAYSEGEHGRVRGASRLPR